jgi:hypothetical protein
VDSGLRWRDVAVNDLQIVVRIPAVLAERAQRLKRKRERTDPLTLASVYREALKLGLAAMERKAE